MTKCVWALGLCAALTAPAAGQPGGEQKIVEARFEAVYEVAKRQQARIVKLEQAVKEVKERPALADADRQKVDGLLADLDRVKLELAGLGKELDGIKSSLSKQGGDLEALKKALDALKAVQDKLEAGAVKGQLDRIEKAPEEFKAFTRVLAQRVGGNMGNFRVKVELEASEADKRVPLKGQLVTAYYQVKDGELRKFDGAVTDANGVAQFEFSNRAWPQGTGVVYKFAGSPTHRPSESKRMQVK